MDEFKGDVGRRWPSCNVSSAFNFGVGAVALVAAALIAYLVLT
jgi:hypothetical protein